MNIENDIPKYQKKKKSSTSKSKTKSNHKHEYEDCLVVINKFNRPYKATYCKICGKIGELLFLESSLKLVSEKAYRVMNSDEIFEKYSDLKKFYIDDMWQKYVSIEDGDN